MGRWPPLAGQSIAGAGQGQTSEARIRVIDRSGVWQLAIPCMLLILQPCTVWAVTLCVCTVGDSATPPLPSLFSMSPPHTKEVQSSDQLPQASHLRAVFPVLVKNWYYQQDITAGRLHTYYIRMLYVHTYEYWPVVITAVRAHYTQHLEPLTYSPWLLLTFDPLGICYATDFQHIFCKSTKFRGTRSDSSTYALIAGPERGGDMCVCLWLWRRQAFEGWNYAAFTSAYHLSVPSFRFPAFGLSEPFPKSAIALTAK